MCQISELIPDSARFDRIPITVQEDIALFQGNGFHPQQGILLKHLRNIDAPDFIIFGVDILMSGKNILSRKLDNFADPGSGGCHEAYDIVIQVLLIA